jgi:hypothetical protein
MGLMAANKAHDTVLSRQAHAENRIREKKTTIL